MSACVEELWRPPSGAGQYVKGFNLECSRALNQERRKSRLHFSDKIVFGF